MEKDKNKYKQVGERWKKAYIDGDYEFHVNKKNNCDKYKKTSRVWKKIFSLIGIKNGQGKQAFEVGCGESKQCIILAFNSWQCTGIDVSMCALERAKNYIDEILKFCKKKLEIKLICQDFFDYKISKCFDLVFHVGVLEHFLDDRERLLALKKMFDLTRPGGHVVSIVPSGIHPLREKSKKFGLGGYSIPEIDYNPVIMRLEFEKCGGKDIVVLPHNMFGYLLIDNATTFKKIINKLIYYFFQLIPISFYPRDFAFRHAYSLIGIAKI